MPYSTLSLPWQACLSETWQAYCAGTTPIGAVIVDASGPVIARGRNHIHDDDAPPSQIGRHTLAHAEINALLSLCSGPETAAIDWHTCALYTAVEPCPLCLGAIYMSGVRTFYYACRDTYAGSANLLGVTPYLSEKPVHAYHQPGQDLETTVCALQVEFNLQCHSGRSWLVEVWKQTMPGGVRLGEALFQYGFYATSTRQPWRAPQAFDWLGSKAGDGPRP
jgi:tRNA(adenine34) deaminase